MMKNKRKKEGKSGKRVKKSSFLESGFFAGFLGAKAAGLSDEEALISTVIFDDDES
jgi:hypothetical protein